MAGHTEKKMRFELRGNKKVMDRLREEILYHVCSKAKEGLVTVSHYELFGGDEAMVVECHDPEKED